MMTEAKKPYISNEDRPSEYDLETPVGSLRVRDLATILDRLSARPQKIHPKFEGHSPLKEFFDKPFPEVFAPDDRSRLPAVPEIDQLIQAVSGLVDTVEQLSAKVDGLERKAGG